MIVTLLESHVRDFLEAKTLKFYQERGEAIVIKVECGHLLLELERIDDTEATTIGGPTNAIHKFCSSEQMMKLQRKGKSLEILYL